MTGKVLVIKKEWLLDFMKKKQQAAVWKAIKKMAAETVVKRTEKILGSESAKTFIQHNLKQLSEVAGFDK
jgi:hypothetical protein